MPTPYDLVACNFARKSKIKDFPNVLFGLIYKFVAWERTSVNEWLKKEFSTGSNCQKDQILNFTQINNLTNQLHKNGFENMDQFVLVFVRIKKGFINLYSNFYKYLLMVGLKQSQAKLLASRMNQTIDINYFH